MKLTGERCILGKSGGLLENEHLCRYQFALQYVDGKNVLDIGCGSGYGADLIASKASEVIGVDISEEAVNYARQHCKRKNIKFYVGDAINLNFLKDGELDVIISLEVIEHIPNYFQYLKEIRRLLKDDGILIISTPNKKYHSPDYEKPKNPFHVTEFWLDDLEKLLRKYFRDVKLYGQNYQTTVKRIVRKLLPTVKGIIIKLLSQRVWQTAFLQKTKDIYNTRQASNFSNERVEKHFYFVAICKK